MDFASKFESRVRKTIRDYGLFTKKDRILVAASGGKDSTVVLYLLNKLGYNVEALIVDLEIGNYSKYNLINVKKFCRDYNIKLHKTSFKHEFGSSKCNLEAALKLKGMKFNSACSICGVLRKYVLNKKARVLKFDKIVTGHNLDDESQAIVMNFLRNTMSLQSRQGPISGNVVDKKLVTRVKPLYLSMESDIRKYSKIMKFQILYDRCPCIANSFRNRIRDLLNDMPYSNKVKLNIVENFLKMKKGIIAKHGLRGSILSCEKCKEPSSDKVCTTCRIIERLK